VKFLALDWERAFGFLEALGKVTPATRQWLARAELRALFEARSLGTDVRVLVTAGIAAPTLDSAYVRLSDDFLDTHKLLRSLQRVPLHSAPNEELLERYVVEHFEEDERYSLGRLAEGYDGGLRGIIARLTSATHTRGLLEADDPAHWEEDVLERARILARGRAPEARFTPESGADLRLLLLHVIGGPGGVRARELPKLFPELSRERLAVAVQLGLRYGVLFAGLEGQGELQLFQWPRVHARLHAGTPRSPAPVQMEEGFAFAWALEDLQHLLVLGGEGLRMKADGSELFAADERELAAGLVPIPDWLADTGLDVLYGVKERLRNALALAFAGGFASLREEERGTRFEVVEPGWSWLGASPRARFEALLVPLRTSMARADGRQAVGPFRVTFRSVRFTGRGDEGRIFRALASCFAGLEAGKAYPARAFLLHHASASNPLQALVRTRPQFFGEFGEDDLEDEFQLDLRSLLLQWLLPWGGVRAGRTRGEELAFELTSIGRYLLGSAPDFESDPLPHEEQAPVRVQPDFEVLFVAPSPMLEARIGRFAERCGKGVGVLFRITRDSIFGAARAGLDAEEVLTTLAEASAGPVPKNVAHEIQNWFARCRRFELDSVHLLRCPDAETAERVLALGARHLERISETVLALRDASRRAELLRLCAKQGLFVGSARPTRE